MSRRAEKYTDDDRAFSAFSDVVSEKKATCRVCFDFKSWIARKRGATASTETSASATVDDKALEKAGAVVASESTSESTADDCPLDRGELGRRTWSVLHTIAAYYPDEPSAEQRQCVVELMRSLSVLYPCDYCAAGLQKDLKLRPPQTASRTELAKWMCELHNAVNAKLGKPLFDCSLVDQRWRDGWADGRCG